LSLELGASGNDQHWRSDGKPAPVRISGWLDNAAAIASFGLALEPLQRFLYAGFDHFAAKRLE